MGPLMYADLEIHAAKALGLARAINAGDPTPEHEELVKEAESFFNHVANLYEGTKKEPEFIGSRR